MSILKIRPLDTSQVLMGAYEIGDMINASRELQQYLYWKEKMSSDRAAQQGIRTFQRKKDMFEECERFGHFHPDYHKSLEQVHEAEVMLEKIESIRRYKQAETELDDLLIAVAETIAHSISEDIKVPSNDPLPAGDCSSGNCGSGGGCSGNCG